MARSLHPLPKFADRWSYLYLEMGTLDQDAAGLCFRNAGSDTPLPVDQLSCVMLGPGTTITTAAVKNLAENNCLIAWVGEQATRLYAHSLGGTYSSRRLLRQAALYHDEAQRLQVVQRMYQKRFPGSELAGKTIQQIRGMEGLRVRDAYEKTAKAFGIQWTRRDYKENEWDYSSPPNRALSTANACLYGVCHAAIVSAGYSAAIGFIHTGKMLSFVYDVADLYKTDLTVPLAFQAAAEQPTRVERAVRAACREGFYQFGLMERILPDIAEVLGAPDDLAERPEEFEGRIISLADRTAGGGLPGQPQQAGSG